MFGWRPRFPTQSPARPAPGTPPRPAPPERLAKPAAQPVKPVPPAPPATPPERAYCDAAPRYGSARCDQSPGHSNDHSAPLPIGGRLTWKNR